MTPLSPKWLGEGQSVLWRNDKVFEEPGHITELLAREAVAWLGKESPRPFLLYLAFTSPHVPLSESEPWMGLYIVFILTDDQRWDALGEVNKAIRTPNLDRLPERGVRFSNTFVTLSICSPSRAVCLTDQYGRVNGVTSLGQGIRPESPMFRKLLQAAGYRTAMIGKWHLGNEPRES